MSTPGKKSVLLFIAALGLCPSLCRVAVTEERAAVRKPNPPPQPAAPTATRGNNRRPANPAAAAPAGTGRVTAYEAGKSIQVEVRRRGDKTEKLDFKIDATRTKIELGRDVKAIAVGASVSVWSDPMDRATALRIAAGPPNGMRPAMRQPNPAMPANRMNAPSPTQQVAKAEIVLPVKPLREPVAGLQPLAAAEQIDGRLEASLQAAKETASPLCTDADFLRRAYLDVTGIIPTAEQAVAFLDDRDPQKRAKLIDALLADPRFGRHFADLCCRRILSKDLAIETEPFIAWLAAELNAGRGWDESVFDIVTAAGEFNFSARGRRMATVDPAAFFVLCNTEGGNGQATQIKPEWLAAESARLFLGVQLQCAECHNHPFTDSWKQTDFWGLAAFYGGLRADRPQQGAVQWVDATAAATEPVSIVIPQTALKNVGQSVAARLLGATEDFLPRESQQLRRTLAGWMTSPENAFFARAAVNRTWAHFFGRGLVNPVDDLRPDNPATHPEVLDGLTQEFVRSRFDLKHLIRCICLSRAYQRSSEGPASDDSASYGRMTVKVLSPGVFYDSLARAVGLQELKLGLPERKTIVTTLTNVTPRDAFMDFHRAAIGVEADPLEYAYGMPQKLKLLNAAQLNQALPTAVDALSGGATNGAAVEKLYLTALGRRPTSEEAKLFDEFLARQKDVGREQALSDALWVLVNGSEFVTNH